MTEIFSIFLHGLKLDLSAVGYIMVIPGLILSFSFILNQNFVSALLKFYTLSLLVFASFINIIDLALYPYWGARVSVTVFNYLDDPKGVFSNVSLLQILGALAIFTLYILFFYWIYNRFIGKYLKIKLLTCWNQSAVLLLLTMLLFIPLRGGFGKEPLKLSKVSFSEKLYINHSAYNFIWYFMHSVTESLFHKNPCEYLTIGRANEVYNKTENTRIPSDSTFIELNPASKPNVILIILESFSNKTILSLGGNYQVCPNIDSVCRESVIFPYFYASGNRSDKGIAALLGSYPSLLSKSIINYPEKYSELTPITHYFIENEYRTSFYYGGNIEFYHLETFVEYAKYEHVVSISDFPRNLQKMSNWGVPDGFLFDRVLDEIKTDRPFFTTVYTISSHPPFDVPYNKIQGKTIDDKYLNSVAYTDSCLGSFISNLKKSNIWDNTLVIITSDHGALQPGPTEIIEPETFRIPLIWTGGVIKQPGVINKLGGQPDLAATLVRQLGWEPQPAKFGHDIFSSPSYAFYMCDTGWGYVTENEGTWFYDQNSAKFISFSKGKSENPDFEFGKAYMQLLHEDF